MSPTVVVCPIHGAFESRMFEVRNAKNLTLTGGSEPCPQCGRPARLMQGTFDADDQGMVTLLTGPTWTREALLAVEAAAVKARQALEEGKSLNHALNVIADTNKALAEEVLAQAQTHGWNKETVLLLITNLITLLGVLLQVPGAVNDLRDGPPSDREEPAVHVEREERDGEQGSSPSGTGQP